MRKHYIACPSNVDLSILIKLITRTSKTTSTCDICHLYEQITVISFAICHLCEQTTAISCGICHLCEQTTAISYIISRCNLNEIRLD